MTLTFWQNILSPHQAPFLRALAGTGHHVTVVTAEALTADRVANGWTVPDLGSARIIINPDEEATNRLVDESPASAVHILAGARWQPLGNRATRRCLAQRRRVGIMSESPDPRGLAGLLRWGKYAAERAVRGRHYDFILAMGEMGVRWFRRCGYPARKVFPFAYVVDGVEGRDAVRTDGCGEVRFLFVGRFVHLKGLDLLLSALAPLHDLRVSLQMVGDGPEKPALMRQADEAGLADRIEWLPSVPNSQAQALMAEADVLVLPSRKDGWGAVVNEALMAGTPVICSDACGAAELIQHPWLGTIFRSGDVTALSAALQSWVAQGPRTREGRQRIRDWSTCISGHRVAEYLAAILEHTYGGVVPPSAPWRLVTNHWPPGN